MGWRAAVCGGERSRIGGTWLKEWLRGALEGAVRMQLVMMKMMYEGDDHAGDGRMPEWYPR